MRITAEELIAELQKLEPKAQIDFRLDVSQGSNTVEIRANHMRRVDNFGHAATVIIAAGI